MLMQQVSPNPFVQLFVDWPLLRKQRRSTLLWSRKSRAHTRRQSGKALAISTSKSTNAFGASASWSPLFAKGVAIPTLPVSVDGRSQLQAHGQKVPCVCNVLEFGLTTDPWALIEWRLGFWTTLLTQRTLRRTAACDTRREKPQNSQHWRVICVVCWVLRFGIGQLAFLCSGKPLPLATIDLGQRGAENKICKGCNQKWERLPVLSGVDVGVILFCGRGYVFVFGDWVEFGQFLFVRYQCWKPTNFHICQLTPGQQYRFCFAMSN